MKRRAFIAGLGTAAAWPVLARGQQSTRPCRVGLLIGQSEDDPEAQVRRLALEHALYDLGWTPERLQIHTRFTAGDPERTRVYVAQLISLKPHLLVAHTTIAASAALEQTRTIPVVFLVVSDPVGTGLSKALHVPAATLLVFQLRVFSRKQMARIAKGNCALREPRRHQIRIRRLTLSIICNRSKRRPGRYHWNQSQPRHAMTRRLSVFLSILQRL